MLLGSIASELLIDKMGAPQRDVRFYATVCCAELRPRNAIYALAERLFDQDFGVRASAIEALAGYPVADLGHAHAAVAKQLLDAGIDRHHGVEDAGLHVRIELHEDSGLAHAGRLNEAKRRALGAVSCRWRAGPSFLAMSRRCGP